MHGSIRRFVGRFPERANRFIGAIMDISLLTIFKAHLHQLAARQRYRPVYLRSGRRNRGRP